MFSATAESGLSAAADVAPHTKLEILRKRQNKTKHFEVYLLLLLLQLIHLNLLLYVPVTKEECFDL
jgi:hypothetical protein